jgi:predicted RNA-binding protein with PIN domain
MEDRLIVVDGDSVVERAAVLKPGEGRTLSEAREKLINLLSWAVGMGEARFMVVFNADPNSVEEDDPGARVEAVIARPPMTADALIRRIVEEQIERVDRLTVVTSDIEVARHARAQGADISLGDLFMASVLGAAASEEPEKPAAFSKKEVEDWAELFSRGRATPDSPAEDDGSD